MQDLSEKITLLAKSVDSERDTMKGFTDKVGRMEERMKFLLNLSEVLSMNYNPFLGHEEAEPFAGGANMTRPTPGNGNGVREIVPVVPEDDAPVALAVPGIAPAQPAPADAAAPAPAPPSLGLDALLPPSDPSPGSAGPAPAASALAPALSFPPMPPLMKAPSVPVSGMWKGPPGVPVAEMSAQGLRESYVTLQWFEYMLQTVEPQDLHRFIDYYREVGWIGEEVHQWMRNLAQGIAPRDESAPPSRVVDPKELVHIHMTSLRFLDYLAGNRLNEGEVVQLEHAIKRLAKRG